MVTGDMAGKGKNESTATAISESNKAFGHFAYLQLTGSWILWKAKIPLSDALASAKIRFARG
jgi:hypothetical protein